MKVLDFFIRSILKLSRYTLKFCLSVVAIFAVYLLFTTFVIHGQRKNVELASDFKQYLISEPNGYRHNNAAIASIGIRAPVHVKDSYAWALKLVDEELAEFEKMGFVRNPDDSEFANLRKMCNFIGRVEGFSCGGEDVNYSYVSARDKIDAMPDKLVYETIANKSLGCFYDGGLWYSNFPDWQETCVTKQEVAKLAEQNKLFLARYLQVLDYRHYKTLPNFISAGGQSLIDANKLLLAELVANAQNGKPEKSLQTWLKLNAFYRRALADENTLVDKSILMVINGMVLDALPAIIDKKSELAKKFEADLSVALSPFPPAEYNLAGMMKAEYFGTGHYIDFFGNYYKNKFLEFSKDIAKLGQFTSENLASEQRQFSEKWGQDDFFRNIDWADPIYGTVYNLLIGGVSVGNSLIESMHMVDARIAVLNLHVNLVANKVPQSQLSEYLNKLPAKFNNPLTEKPFIYSAEEGVIYFYVDERHKLGLKAPSF